MLFFVFVSEFPFGRKKRMIKRWKRFWVFRALMLIVGPRETETRVQTERTNEENKSETDLRIGSAGTEQP